MDPAYSPLADMNRGKTRRRGTTGCIGVNSTRFSVNLAGNKVDVSPPVIAKTYENLLHTTKDDGNQLTFTPPVGSRSSTLRKFLTKKIPKLNINDINNNNLSSISEEESGNGRTLPSSLSKLRPKDLFKTDLAGTSNSGSPLGKVKSSVMPTHVAHINNMSEMEKGFSNLPAARRKRSLNQTGEHHTQEKASVIVVGFTKFLSKHWKSWMENELKNVDNVLGIYDLNIGIIGKTAVMKIRVSQDKFDYFCTDISKFENLVVDSNTFRGQSIQNRKRIVCLIAVEEEDYVLQQIISICMDLNLFSAIHVFNKHTRKLAMVEVSLLNQNQVQEKRHVVKSFVLELITKHFMFLNRKHEDYILEKKVHFESETFNSGFFSQLTSISNGSGIKTHIDNLDAHVHNQERAQLDVINFGSEFSALRAYMLLLPWMPLAFSVGNANNIDNSNVSNKMRKLIFIRQNMLMPFASYKSSSRCSSSELSFGFGSITSADSFFEYLRTMRKTRSDPGTTLTNLENSIMEVHADENATVRGNYNLESSETDTEIELENENENFSDSSLANINDNTKVLQSESPKQYDFDKFLVTKETLSELEHGCNPSLIGLESIRNQVEHFTSGSIDSDSTLDFHTLLLFGPPGCGKTSVVYSIIKSCIDQPGEDSMKPQFIYVPCSDLYKSSFKNTFKLSELFAFAQKIEASKRVIVLDNFDDICRSRRRKVELLHNLGLLNQSSKFKNLVLIGITTAPWEIDLNVFRFFERKIVVPLSSPETRLKLLLSKVAKVINIPDNDIDPKVRNDFHDRLNTIAVGMRFFSTGDLNLCLKDAVVSFKACSIGDEKEPILLMNKLCDCIEKSSWKLNPTISVEIIELYNKFLMKFGEKNSDHKPTLICMEKPDNKSPQFSIFS